ncbi:Pyrimidine reductase, riboflavin biosynthesis [Lawsonia intracellularis PHE/MN1-00]|uniref:Riboflavin biosynthesis protein RibD n=1 Tax=Lawsonia intracellularis (strain PHE/MN1-00) TaxID=363253 RepID=Q1MS12_LAWIP|nr:Pyrimidine reductase, riboflavin biosynthesis [Lawsonia intracellularis PHE/MN1-00]
MSLQVNHPYDYAMKYAISIAEKGRWDTAPNPVVGSVLIQNGKIVAEGFHSLYGGPHAEVLCINDAKNKHINLSDCTLITTLEPCNHYGKTPPCTKAIIDNNIKHVIIGTKDPTTLASGGVHTLTSAGITVEVGILEKECQALIADFITWQNTSRPYILLKLATTLDGKIATSTGHSKWISSEVSRQKVHKLRENVGKVGGAILIGGNTLKLDNPQLTCRNNNNNNKIQQPLAIIITSTLPEQQDIYLFNSRPTETIIYTTPQSGSTQQATTLRKKGVKIVTLKNWSPDLSAILTDITEHIRSTQGCLYMLCEGGGKLGSSLLKANLVDELHIYLSPKILGDNNALPIVNGRNPLTIHDAISLKIHTMELSGSDIHLTFRPEM